MGAGRVLCDDVLRGRMRTCVLSVSSTVGRSVGQSVGRSVDPGTTSQHQTTPPCISVNFLYTVITMTLFSYFECTALCQAKMLLE